LKGEEEVLGPEIWFIGVEVDLEDSEVEIISISLRRTWKVHKLLRWSKVSYRESKADFFTPMPFGYWMTIPLVELDSQSGWESEI